MFRTDPAFCVASGPSLTAEDCAALDRSGRFVVAVNDTYRLLRRPSIVYAADYDWWRVHAGDVARTHPGVPRYSVTDFIEPGFPSINYVEGTSRVDFSLTPPIAYGGNSGFQAINLAALLGRRDIVLLGYDMGPAADGRTHFFGDHPAPLRNDSRYSDWLARIERAAPVIERAGVRVFNASRETRITCWPRISLEAALGIDTRTETA